MNKIVCTMFDYGNEIGISLADSTPGAVRPEVRVSVGASNLALVQKVLAAVNELLEKAENAR